MTVVRERNPEASSLLDVACGTGEHLRLVRPAFAHVEGVDVEPDMLAVARAKLPDVVFTEADMRTFDLGRTFDAVTCLFSSVGYMADVGELRAAVARMAAHLAPGGVLVIDGWIRPDAWRPGGGVMAQCRDRRGDGGRPRRAESAGRGSDLPRDAVPGGHPRRVRHDRGDPRPDPVRR